MKVISIVNHKGGVGKTTTSLHLGIGLSKLGYKVRCIDLDIQTNLTQWLLPEDNERPDIGDVILSSKMTIDEIAVNSESELEIVPATERMVHLELSLFNELGRENLLKRALDRSGQCDFVILDCPPNLGLICVNALTASDFYIVPLNASYFSLFGLKLLNSSIDKVKERMNPKLENLGILMNIIDGREKKINEKAKEVLTGIYKDKIFDNRINVNTNIKSSPADKKSIFTYDPDSRSPIEYMALVHEIVGRLGRF